MDQNRKPGRGAWRVSAWLLWVVVVGSTGATEIYVAPGGTGDGSLARPLGSLEAAREAVRRRTAGGLDEEVTVTLRGGTYHLERPLVFGPADGGTVTHAVTYRAYPGERPVLSGGRILRGWRSGSDGTWTLRLTPANGAGGFRQLYADGRRLARSRYPREGFLKIAAVSPDGKTLTLTEPLNGPTLSRGDAELVVVQNWSISREGVVSQGRDTVTARTPIGWVGHSHCLPKPGMSVFCENVPGSPADPGQWSLERRTGLLTYRPRAGQDPRRMQFVAPVLTGLIRITGTAERPVRNLHLRGLALAHTGFDLPAIGYGGIQACYYGTSTQDSATYAVPAAIELDYAEDCRLVDLRFRMIGGSGIGLGAGCRSNRILACDLADIGATGVHLGFMRVKDPLWADWPTPRDVPVANEVADCVIRTCGADLWGAHGIFDAMTRDSHIHHNEVSAIPYGGIATGYVWGTQRTSQQGCVIEYNHVHEVMLRLNDSGCIYTLGFQPGSIIRGNLLHGVRFGGYAGGQVCNNGIFFDEGSKGFLLEGNVIYDVDQQRGSKNTPVRFNRSQRDWQIWIDNTITTDTAAPAAAVTLAKRAGPRVEVLQGLRGGER